MLKRAISHTASLLPQGPLGHLGWLRGAAGAGLGIGAMALVTMALLAAGQPGLPLILAPMGASAVLLFGLPASPLAQPWAVIGGNLLAAIAGLAAGMATGSPVLAGAVGVTLAIAVMSVGRCLHPPGGGTALLYAVNAAGAVTGGEAWGWLHLVPLAANVLALAACGWAYNNLTGHQWPHRLVVPPPAPRPAASTAAAAPFTHEQVLRVMDDWDEVLDVDPDDLLAFAQALDRHRAGA